MTNRDVAQVLDQVADLLEFKGANPFRVRAYRNAAHRIRSVSEPLAAIAADSTRSLTEIPGIGKDLAEKIQTLLATGALPMLADLQQETPPGVLVISRVPGVGPKKAVVLCRELGIASLEDLRCACQEGRVQGLKGFGVKTEIAILKGLETAEMADVRLRWADADIMVQLILDALRKSPGLRELEAAGSYRRGRDTVGDVDILADAADSNAVMDRLGQFGHTAEIVARGVTKMTVRLDNGLQVDLRVVPAESFGAALQYFTGSKDHNVTVRGLAKQLGLRVNEWGVFRVEDDAAFERLSESERKASYVAGRTEEEVYSALGLPWFPPEIREARDEFDWAAGGQLPELITLEQVRGDLHMHTTDSDGQGTLEEMVEAARVRGLEYIAITDHSKRVSMARGLDGSRLRRQWDEIDALNSRLTDIVVLKGVECDILEPGGMDLPDDVLAEADWVIASIHYGQQQPREQITNRILGALENPHVDLLAHPTGRLINRRSPYQVDMDAVMEAAARYGKMMELNSNPARLDLDDLHLAAARRYGIPIVINTDAHSTGGMEVMRYGILQARRGGLTAAHVVNTRPWREFKKLIGK